MSIEKKMEYKVLNMPRNTLLEPNNVIAAWCGANSSEEVGEVSATLKALRKKYDVVHQTVLAKQNELEKLKRKLAKTCEEEIYLTNLNESKKENMDNTDKELADLKEEHDFEKLTKAQYEYTKKRMQKDLIATQLKTQELQTSLKSKKAIQEAENEKLRLAKQQRNQANQRLRQIMLEIDTEQVERQHTIKILEHSCANKENALKRRIERVERQQQIAELAANENKN